MLLTQCLLDRLDWVQYHWRRRFDRNLCILVRLQEQNREKVCGEPILSDHSCQGIYLAIGRLLLGLSNVLQDRMQLAHSLDTSYLVVRFLSLELWMNIFVSDVRSVMHLRAWRFVGGGGYKLLESRFLRNGKIVELSVGAVPAAFFRALDHFHNAGKS
jgi:hypothetical protein